MTTVKEAPALDEELEDKIAGEDGKRLTPAEWAEIKELWELGATSADEICEKYGVKAPALRRRFVRYGVKKGSRAHEVASAAGAGVKAAAAAAPAPAAPAPAAPAASAEEISAARKRAIDAARKEHLDFTGTLIRAAMGRLAAAQKDGRPFSSEDANLKAIERTMKVLKMGREERWDLLDAHGEVDEKELPEFTIKNLTDQRIKALREKQEEEDGDLVEDDSLDLTLPGAGPDEEDDGVVEETDGD